MRRLARFLGITVAPGAWPALMEAAGFDRMRSCADDTAPGAHLGDWQSNAAFFARGRLDGWKDVLSEANQALYQTLAPQRADPALRGWLEGGRATVGDPQRL